MCVAQKHFPPKAENYRWHLCQLCGRVHGSAPDKVSVQAQSEGVVTGSWGVWVGKFYISAHSFYSGCTGVGINVVASGVVGPGWV